MVETTKTMVINILTYMVEDSEDKKRMLIALKDLLNTSIAEEESIRLSISAIYNRYVRDTDIYLQVFKELNLDIQPEQTTEPVKEEVKPTKKEIETKKQQDALQVEVEKTNKTIEEEAEEYDQNKFREKMKESSPESITDRLNFLRKKWFIMPTKKTFIEKEAEYIDTGILKLIRENSNLNLVIWLLLALLGISLFSQLNYSSLLTLISIIFIAAFFMVKSKYNKTIEELKTLKQKLK